ncbi:hypothetical protein KL930_003121 [Ogataea haglerorum]|uniref:Protein ECM19 n=1 Tax=Ogataea haglerorum TaxID=1937702 RepID=A0AAN6D381_9ASCO|nr:uncharacterized protein KL911_002624 [Ogataea haglerorum]KAG7696095.1 hypothetical protein KL915_002459 [Ogataea haglerorum]KAG7696466.1 hypothetical protein KL951_002922 [Ogataea haglerorum]KAG7707089.1 hypothetical protein KL914_002973 [Ogataea haglerorum]KAG7708604.1 hypothetical protein KL950_002124 [Ogataea haglerorum]KAG7713774.1 hypothetical protein KL913_004798 [Ogataea haglerorum]
MSMNVNKALTMTVFAAAGVYMGMKFFEPIVIEQLRKDGNLRTDIEVPQYDEEGNKLLDRGKQVTWEAIRREGQEEQQLADSSVSKPVN